VLVSILGFYIKGVLVALLPSSSSSSSSEIAHKLGTLHPSLVHAANNNKKENSHKKNKFQGGDRWRSVSHTAPLPDENASGLEIFFILSGQSNMLSGRGGLQSKKGSWLMDHVYKEWGEWHCTKGVVTQSRPGSIVR
jgi:hypothetical protein